jgi:hypothetical protein
MPIKMRRRPAMNFKASMVISLDSAGLKKMHALFNRNTRRVHPGLKEKSAVNPERPFVF